MANWIIDTSRVSFSAARLALLPGTEFELEQLRRFADYLDECIALRLQAYTAVAPPAPQLRRAAPMRPQSMAETPPRSPDADLFAFLDSDPEMQPSQ